MGSDRPSGIGRGYGPMRHDTILGVMVSLPMKTGVFGSIVDSPFYISPGHTRIARSAGGVASSSRSSGRALSRPEAVLLVLILNGPERDAAVERHQIQEDVEALAVRVGKGNANRAPLTLLALTLP